MRLWVRVNCFLFKKKKKQDDFLWKWTRWVHMLNLPLCPQTAWQLKLLIHTVSLQTDVVIFHTPLSPTDTFPERVETHSSTHQTLQHQGESKWRANVHCFVVFELTWKLNTLLGPIGTRFRVRQNGWKENVKCQLYLTLFPLVDTGLSEKTAPH